jgi:hypothetical protein
MFNTQKDYENAIKSAQIYRTEERPNRGKLLPLNLLIVALLAYVGFAYLKSYNKTTSLPISKQAVLGVSETIDDSVLDDDKLMDILKDVEVDSVENSMKISAGKPSIQSASSYTEAIARELEDMEDKRKGFRGRIAVVNQKN